MFYVLVMISTQLTFTVWELYAEKTFSKHLNISRINISKEQN